MPKKKTLTPFAQFVKETQADWKEFALAFNRFLEAVDKMELEGIQETPKPQVPASGTYKGQYPG